MVSLSEFSCKVIALPRWVYSSVALKTVAAVRKGNPTPMLAVMSCIVFSKE